MIQLGRWQDGAAHQTKVRGNVGGWRFGDDARVPNRIAAVLIDKWVKRREIKVTYFFIFFCIGIQLNGFCSSPDKGITRFKTKDNAYTLLEGSHVFALFLEVLPFTFPLDNELVAGLAYGFTTGKGVLVHIIHGLIIIFSNLQMISFGAEPRSLRLGTWWEGSREKRKIKKLVPVENLTWNSSV